jgi:hypothetical protein
MLFDLLHHVVSIGRECTRHRARRYRWGSPNQTVGENELASGRSSEDDF